MCLTVLSPSSWSSNSAMVGERLCGLLLPDADLGKRGGAKGKEPGGGGGVNPANGEERGLDG